MPTVAADEVHVYLAHDLNFTAELAALMADMKLQALDGDDLAILAAQSQDAIVRAGDIAFLPKERRFALVANRFDWLSAVKPKDKKDWKRRAAGLRFEAVKRAQVTGFDPSAADAVLVLLSIEFTPAEAPAGWITLQFAAGAAIRLEVEYIEAELKDLGAVWSTKNRPDHNQAEPGKS
jgi:hypothetical protein